MKSFTHYQRFWQKYKTIPENEDFLLIMNLIREIANLLFYFFDNMYILRKMKVLKGNMIHLFVLSTFFELISHLSKVLIDVQQLLQVQENIRQLNFKNSTENLLKLESQNSKAEMNKIIKKIIIGSADFFMALMQLQFLFETKFSNGIISTVGILSSALSIY